MLGIPHRYLTSRVPGVGGVIKRSIEDFVVHEVPLYFPEDRGEHTFFEIEKSDLSTLEAVERVARGLGVQSTEIGFAGLKDRKAVTRQVLSIGGVSPERVLALRLSQIRVLWARRHGNRLRVGHLRGNRFRIWVRDATITEQSRKNIRQIIDTVERLGVPNYYGPQRFGIRGDSFRVGHAMLLHRHEEAVRGILGRPCASERNPHVILGRHRFMESDLRGAHEAFPRSYRVERNLLSYLIQSNCNYRGAIKRLPRPVKKIYYSAFQSFLFNRLLDRRLEIAGSPAKLFVGDLAFLHRNGAVFLVDDPAREQPRADAFEISPSGPIFGMMMPEPQGLQAELEDEVLRTLDLRRPSFHQLMPGLRMKGGRRPLRVDPRELRWEIVGRDVVFEFFLPKGAYATTFLREVIKLDDAPTSFYTERLEEIAIPDPADLFPVPGAEEITGQPPGAPGADDTDGEGADDDTDDPEGVSAPIGSRGEDGEG